MHYISFRSLVRNEESFSAIEMAFESEYLAKIAACGLYSLSKCSSFVVSLLTFNRGWWAAPSSAVDAAAPPPAGLSLDLSGDGPFEINNYDSR